MPENEHEIVIDKMVYRRTETIKMFGLYNVEKMLGVKVYLNNRLLEYTIVGIVDKESPSIYVNNSEFIKIIDNSKQGGNYFDVSSSSSDGGANLNGSVTSTCRDASMEYCFEYDLLQKGTISIALLSQEECYDKYVKALLSVVENDFGVYRG